MLPTGPAIPARRITPHARTLGDLFKKRCEASPRAPAVYEKKAGIWVNTTWGDFFTLASKAAKGLLELGVKRGDRVAILGPTKLPWAVYDMASQLVGAVSFGIYPKQAPEQVKYLLEHSEAKVVLVDGRDELETVLEGAKGVASLSAIVPWTEGQLREAQGRDERLTSPSVLAREALTAAEVERLASAVSPDDIAILVYTSGTTGPPKGAMISHRNIITLLSEQQGIVDFLQSDLSLNFLPMAHSAERIFAFFGRIDSGITTAYAESMGSVLANVAEVKPTLFGAVPRIFEKAYAKVQGELEKKPPAVKKLFAWAIGVGKACTTLELAGKPVPPALAAQRLLADRLVYRKIKGAFGGRVRFFVTGAAPIARDILDFFWAVGLPIYEVYGMTEATVVTHANRPGATKLGTVGRVIPPMQAKIADDGEILMKGPWVFQGYFKNEDATRETVIDGWLHTGDIGTIDADGYLKITDRKKHIIITAGGKNLSPANIENAIKNQDPLVSQVYAHGDRRPYVIAIVAPSPLETLAFGVERGIVNKATADALTHELLEQPSSRSPALNEAMGRVVVDPAFKQRIREAVKRGNQHLAHVEQVHRFALLDRDFSQEAGEMTPTMKVKRKAIEKLHADLIERVYAEDGHEV